MFFVGLFIGFVILIITTINLNYKYKQKLDELEKQNNLLKRVKDFHIGQEVYGCEYLGGKIIGFHKGKISKIVQCHYYTEIYINDKSFDLKNICLDFKELQERLEKIK